MRDLIITQNITLDGVIDAAGGWFDVGNDADLGDVAETLREHSAASDALLVGRSTFESFRAFWPQQTDDETGVREHLNRVHKYVVSSTLTDPGWEPTTVLGIDDIAAVKAGEGGDIVCTGSLTLVPELIARGLVDEFRLFVYPVVLGSGQRLFERPLASSWPRRAVPLRHRAAALPRVQHPRRRTAHRLGWPRIQRVCASAPTSSRERRRIVGQQHPALFARPSKSPGSAPHGLRTAQEPLALRVASRPRGAGDDAARSGPHHAEYLHDRRMCSEPARSTARTAAAGS